jgi:hypothetical protein
MLNQVQHDTISFQVLETNSQTVSCKNLTTSPDSHWPYLDQDSLLKASLGRYSLEFHYHFNLLASLALNSAISQNG